MANAIGYFVFRKKVGANCSPVKSRVNSSFSGDTVRSYYVVTLFFEKNAYRIGGLPACADPSLRCASFEDDSTGSVYGIHSPKRPPLTASGNAGRLPLTRELSPKVTEGENNGSLMK